MGGTELNAVRTAERLVADGLDVRVAVLRNEGPLVARYAANGIPVTEFPLRSLMHPSTATQVLRLARFFRRHRIDVVHCHDRYTNVVAVTAARLARVPAVIASKRWLWWPRFFRTANAVAYRLATRVLANSAAVAETLRASEHVPVDRIIVIPNFVDDGAFMPVCATDRAAFRTGLGLASDAVLVGIVARVAAVKNHRMLLDAAAELRDRWPDVRYVIIGDGPERETLAREVESRGLTAIVRFAGHRPQTPNPHGFLDLSVLCSNFEGFPNSVVEAMAAAKPVIATAVGGVPDAVEDGLTGLLVPPRDAGRLAKALDTLLADPRRREHMGRVAQSAARTRFHSSVVTPALEREYERLVSAARAS